nr:uncharacterized protein LOC106681564 [Halyomorpha halys]
MLNYFLLGFLCVLSTQSSISIKSDPTNSASLDNILDQISNNIRTKGKEIGLDSFPLQDIHTEINQGSGKPIIFNLTNGVINNVTSIERYGSSAISYSSKILKFNMGFHFTALEIECEFNVLAWNLNPIGKLKGGIEDFRISTEGSIDVNNLNVTMNKIQIPTTGNIDFSVNTTVPIYGYIIQDLFNTATPFQDIIIYEIGKGLTKKINSIMENLLTSRVMEII